jgi:peptidyl-dipeptidase Dcp
MSHATESPLMTCDSTKTNPLLQDWSSQPFHMPPFSLIEPEHFQDALQQAMRAHLLELQTIAENGAPLSFDSVIATYDRSGKLLARIAQVFSNLCSSLNTPDLQEVQTAMAPLLSRHSSETYQLPGLYDKIKSLYKDQKEALNPEQARLLERIHMDFVRSGAALAPDQQRTLADTNAALASLQTKFTQNVLKDEETWALPLKRSDLSGCPDSLVQAAKRAACERNGDGQPDNGDDCYVITLSRSLVEPFLTFSDRRDLRKVAWKAWISRGEMSKDRDNRVIAVEILKLRNTVAKIHGYKSFADYQCVDRMAKTPAAVMKLLENVWARAKQSADGERQAMEQFLAQNGMVLDDGIQPYDWRYIAELVRKDKYDFDQALLKPYLSLDRVREALFAVSGSLFGLEYKIRPDLKTYHADVDLYEVLEKRSDGSDRLVAIFLHDNFARQFKSSGAWMSEYRTQTKNLASNEDPIQGVPIVSNNNNFARSDDTLLSFDDATTLFHEFGHAHHGMLSAATFDRLASTNVLTDFVELPSQLMEHWFGQREILKKYARHYQTGEAVPDELLDKLEAARSFQQGFQTIEYTACALLDMALHQLDNYDDFDIAQFEEKELARLGMPQGIVMRHRPPHFQHLFSTSMYAAGYYVYLWAEVLDADAFAAFEETGDIFDPETAARARKFIYGAGNTMAPDELFRQFRGRDPDINFMLRKKGLLTEKYDGGIPIQYLERKSCDSRAF